MQNTDLTAEQAADIYAAADELAGVYLAALGEHANPRVRAELLRHMAAAEQRAAEVYLVAFDSYGPDEKQVAQDKQDSARLLTIAATAEQARTDAAARPASDWPELETAAGLPLNRIADPEVDAASDRADAYHDFGVAAARLVSGDGAETVMALAAGYTRLAEADADDDQAETEPAAHIEFAK